MRNAMKPKTVGRKSDIMTVTRSGEASGLWADSIILTLAGEMRVGDIIPGQRIVTRGTGTAIVRSVRHHRVVTQAVRIKAGSLGDTRPDRDATLPAGQRILVRDWRAQVFYGQPQALIAADRLVDGEFITHLDPTRMTLCEIKFDQPHILYVDGLEVVGHVTAATTEIAA